MFQVTMSCWKEDTKLPNLRSRISTSLVEQNPENLWVVWNWDVLLLRINCIGIFSSRLPVNRSGNHLERYKKISLVQPALIYLILPEKSGHVFLVERIAVEIYFQSISFYINIILVIISNVLGNSSYFHVVLADV